MILSPLSDQVEDEVEAMKNQFAALHRRTLDRQTSNQYLLRSPKQHISSNEDTYTANDYDHDEDEKYGEKKRVSFSDGVTAQDDDTTDEKAISDEKDAQLMKDEKAMKEDFNKQQKKLLQSQMAKSFRLRSISIDMDEDKEEFTHELSDIDDETEEKLMEDSEEMKMQFQELNKRMIRMRSTKTCEMGMTPQIKPQHREQFNMLLRDIGIVNEHIMEQLWHNIEQTVHRDDEFTEFNGFEDEEEDDEDRMAAIEEEEEDMKAIETVENGTEWDTNMDDAMQRCAQIAEDLSNEISSFKVNCSQSNIDNIGIRNVEELVAGNSVFHSKLIHFHDIMAKVKGCCVGFMESMDEVERYIARKYIPNEAQYEEWDLNAICAWIKSLEHGRFVPYIDVLLSGFKESQIGNGPLFCDLETADLGTEPFGITNFKDKRDLIRNFKRLKTGIHAS